MMGEYYNWYENKKEESSSLTIQFSKLMKVRQIIAEEKINTTNDKTYDYKLSNGKYYYSLKGQNKWVEAKGNGLNSIKTKVKF